MRSPRGLRTVKTDKFKDHSHPCTINQHWFSDRDSDMTLTQAEQNVFQFRTQMDSHIILSGSFDKCFSLTSHFQLSLTWQSYHFRVHHVFFPFSLLNKNMFFFFYQSDLLLNQIALDILCEMSKLTLRFAAPFRK